MGAGGAGFAVVLHPHPRLPPDTAAGPVRMWPGGVTSGSGNSPCSGPGDKSRLLLHPFPISSPAPRPSGPCAHLHCWLLGTCPPRWGVHPMGYARWAGRGGWQECCHPLMGCSLWAGRMLKGCSRDARGVLEGCLRNAQGTHGLPSGKASHPPGVMDPQWLHQLHPLEVGSLISSVREWWYQSCHPLWGCQGGTRVRGGIASPCPHLPGTHLSGSPHLFETLASGTSASAMCLGLF